MPSAVADFLFHRLINAFPAHRPLLPAAFEREPMPPAVAHFLVRLLQRRLDHELEHLDLPRSAWIHDEHADVQHAHEALRDTLAQHGQFPAAEWEPALRRAVKEVTAYLVRPAATLVSFVFQGAASTIPADVVDRRMGYFRDYAYLHEGVRMYLKQKDLQEIDQTRLADLLRHIDRQITKDYDADAWMRLLHPLFDLVRSAQSDVPVALLQAFFSEKGNETMMRRLAQEQQRHGTETLDEAVLRRLLEAVEAPVLAASSPDLEVVPSLPGAPGAVEEPQGPVPLWKQFQQGHAQPPATNHQAAPPLHRVPEAPPAPSPAREAIPRWMQYRSEAEPVAGEPIPEAPRSLARLEHAVLGEKGPRNRGLFIKHLFAASPADYERVLRRLQAAQDWPEASQIIAEEVFRKNQVNIYSDPAVLFTDAVEARF